MDNIRYKYQKKNKSKNTFVSIRDSFQNCLLEVEKKGDSISIVTYWRNEKTTKFILPIDFFEKLYLDMSNDKEQQ